MSNQFFKIPFSIYTLDLPKNAVMLYGLLCSHANQYGYAFGTNKYYARFLRCSERTISSSIKILKDNNLIRISNPKSYRRKIYIIST